MDMVASFDRNRRAIRVAATILAGLILLVVLANLLWPGPPAPTTAQSRMPQTQGPFPTFPMGPRLHAVRIDANANLSMRLLMTSLQGLVNRASVELYLDVIGAYDRALRELYPSSYPYLLAILPPDRWAIRDYLVQTGTFVFYLTQGMLASPFEAAATMRILQAAPRGIPILGWFNSPTL